jgi:hypothetical protein
MQPHRWIVAIGRTWWAHTSMAENEGAAKAKIGGLLISLVTLLVTILK